MKKKRNSGKLLVVLMAILVVTLILGVAIFINRYSPSKERQSLEDYFELKHEDEAAVIINGTYIESEDIPYGITQNGNMYLELGYLKDKLDDGYVYDRENGILRYTTDTQLVSAELDESAYSIDKEKKDLGFPVVISAYDSTYISMDFMMQFTDFSYSIVTQPNRVLIDTAGFEKKVTFIKRDTELRRFGGVKSKILKDAKKGEKVTVLENYGKWSLVLSEDGVLGCVKNSKIKKSTTETVLSRLPERNYSHNLMDESVVLGWHQVTNQTANGLVDEVVSNTSGMNVISPTWFYLNDDNGGVANLCNADYVSYCHSKGIKVWALVSNVEDHSVNSTTVLNSAKARDQLVTTLISNALSYNIDGINVDMEALSIDSKDGYIQFIRELSLKCESNNLVLSVDNYPPAAHTMFYNRTEQAKYADYLVIMGYDEHYAGSEDIGSVASLDYVKDGVEATLEEAPANQIILGLPFYTRVWISEGEKITSRSLSMDNTEEYLTEHGATITWLDDEAQNYGEFTEDGKTYMVWIEDNKSIEAKCNVAADNKLAGVAGWKLGFEPSSVWSVLKKYY